MDKKLLTPELLVQYLKPVISACTAWNGKTLTVHIIANPCAGGFTQKKKSAVNCAVLEQAAEKAAAKDPCLTIKDIILNKTTHAGHGTQIAGDILAEARAQKADDAQWLIVTAGGDGTHLEVQTALAKAALSSDEDAALIKESVTILRLPFGTGNDGSDGRETEDTLRRLTEPAHFALQRAVKVWYEGTAPDKSIAAKRKQIDTYDSLDALPPWYSFNIASIGIDAYITYMTNKTKGVMPGDFYQVWVDLACLFYGAEFPPKPLTIEVMKDNSVVKTIKSAVEFCLLGVSGHRTYGSNHLILPDDNTFCAVKKMPTVRKVLKKSMYNDGSHIGDKYTESEMADKLRISYDQNILVQMDGEVHLLQPEQFPLIIQHTPPVIRVIECDADTVDKGTVRI